MKNLSDLFTSEIQSAYQSETPLFVVIEQLLESYDKDDVFIEFASYKASTENTINAPRLYVEEKEYHFSLWYQHGVDDVLPLLE